MPKLLRKNRRLPSQERSQQTLRNIIGATAQILSEEGERQISTNRVAQRAGISVGAIYQYFSSKDSLVQAMITRERERVMKKLEELLATAQNSEEELEVLGFVRQYIRVCMHSFGEGNALTRPLIRYGWKHEPVESIAHATREHSEHIVALIRAMKHPQLREMTPAAVFVLTRAVMGVIRSASLEKSALLGTQELEDELVALVWGICRHSNEK